MSYQQHAISKIQQLEEVGDGPFFWCVAIQALVWALLAIAVELSSLNEIQDHH